MQHEKVARRKGSHNKATKRPSPFTDYTNIISQAKDPGGDLKGKTKKKKGTKNVQIILAKTKPPLIDINSPSNNARPQECKVQGTNQQPPVEPCSCTVTRLANLEASKEKREKSKHRIASVHAELIIE